MTDKLNQTLAKYLPVAGAGDVWQVRINAVTDDLPNRIGVAGEFGNAVCAIGDTRLRVQAMDRVLRSRGICGSPRIQTFEVSPSGSRDFYPGDGLLFSLITTEDLRRAVSLECVGSIDYLNTAGNFKNIQKLQPNIAHERPKLFLVKK